MYSSVSLCPHMAERGEGAFWGLCMRALIPFIGVPTLRPNYPSPKALPLNTITLEDRLQHMNLEDMYSVNSIHGMCSAPSWSPSLPPTLFQTFSKKDTCFYHLLFKSECTLIPLPGDTWWQRELAQLQTSPFSTPNRSSAEPWDHLHREVENEVLSYHYPDVSVHGTLIRQDWNLNNKRCGFSELVSKTSTVYENQQLTSDHLKFLEVAPYLTSTHHIS